MKFFVLLILFTGISVSGITQTPKPDPKLDDIFQKHIKALGGLEKLNALNTYQYSSTNSNEQTSTISYKKTGLYNSTYVSEKGESVQIIKGTDNWYKNIDGSATKGNYKAGVVSDIIIHSLHGFLWNAKLLTYKLKLLKPADASDRVETSNLMNSFEINDSSIVIETNFLATDKMKTYFRIFIDPTTYLISAIIENNESSMRAYVFNDYKAVDGINAFNEVSWGSEGKINFTQKLSNFKMNLPLDSKLFIPPVITGK